MGAILKMRDHVPAHGDREAWSTPRSEPAAAADEAADAVECGGPAKLAQES